MDLVSATVILSTESLFALVMAIINIRIIFKLIALVWGKGCTIQQVIDIYDLGGKYCSWLRLDCVLNLVFCFLASHFLGGQWGWGAIPIEMFAAIALPIRFMAAKVSKGVIVVTPDATANAGLSFIVFAKILRVWQNGFEELQWNDFYLLCS